MQTIQVVYTPRNEKPRSRKGPRQFNIGSRVYTLNPGQNNFTPEAIAELENNETWKRLQEYEAIAYNKAVVVDPEEPKKPEKQTVAQRTEDLTKLFDEQGYKPIENLARAMGIKEKPEGGWKETIPLIVNHELNRDLVVE